VRVLPALAGLGAPWWRPDARAVIAGLHGGARPAHIARAALESIAWRVTDIVWAMSELTPLRELRVDGGLSNDPTLVQLQADAIGAPVRRTTADVTVRGAALLAGVGAGVFAGLEDAVKRLPAGELVHPSPGSSGGRAAAHASWRAFVDAAQEL
jgi:glycerol kinase